MAKQKRRKDNQDPPKSPFVQIPLNWIIPDTVPSYFTNWVAVQQDGESFTFSFFDVRRPILIGGEEEVRARLAKIESIPSVCLARIVMSRTKAQQFLIALQTTIDQSEKQRQAEEEERGKVE